MALTIENLFIYLLFVTDLVLIVLFSVFLRQNKNLKTIRLLILYCSVDFVFNFIVEFISSKPAPFLFSFFTFFEFAIFASFFILTIQSKHFRDLIIASGLLYTLFLIVYYTSTKSRSLDSVPIGIETILILIYSFYFFYEQMNNVKGSFIYNQYSFWITTGIMLYLSGAFFIYILANHIEQEMLRKIWYLTNAFYVLKNIFFGVAIMLHIKKKTFILKSVGLP